MTESLKAVKKESRKADTVENCEMTLIRIQHPPQTHSFRTDKRKKNAY
jgi:hypothetical protein